MSIQAKLLLFYTLICSTICGAQNISNYQYYGSESGLSNKHIRCMLQDNNGFIWLGTPNGLNRFDGKTFLNANEVSYSTLVGSNIFSMVADSSDDIIIGSNNGVEIFNTTTFKARTINIDSFIHKKIYVDMGLFKSSKGYIYVNVENYYLLRIDKHYNIIKIRCPNMSNGLFQNLNSITEDNAGHIWLTDYYGSIYTLKDGETQLSLFATFFKQTHRIKFTSKLNLLVCTDFGLYKLDVDRQKLIRIFPLIGPCKYVLEDNSGTIWVSDEFEKLYRFNDGEVTDETDELKLRDEFNYRIGEMIQDKSYNIWVGTNFGLVKFTSPPKKFNYFFTANRKQIDQLNTSVRMFTEDPITKDIYFASYSGIFKINFQTKKIDSILLESNKMIIPYAILYDKGKLWIGTEGTSFYCYDIASKKLKIVDKVITSNRRYPDKLFIVNLFKDKDDQIWISEYAGLLIFNPITEKLTEFKLTQSENDIQEIKVMDIYRSKNDYLWLASNAGVFVLDQNRKLVSHITKKNGLPTNQIKCIVEQDDSIMLFGTAGSGIVKYNRLQNISKVYNTSHGLVDNNINGIFQAKRDIFWISTQNGLSEFYHKTGKFINFRLEDGLPTSEFNSSSSFISSQGEIFFGSINGIVSIPKQMEIDNTELSKLSWSKIYIRNRDDDSTMHWSNNNSHVVIPQDNHFFEIQFALSNYVNPDRNIYYYKLDGLVDVWQNLENQNILRFYELPAGTYQLHVRASTANRNITPHELTLQIVVEQAYYKTWWFITLIILTILLIISIAINNRLKQLKKFADLRVKISSDLHDDVGSVLTRIAMQADLAKRKTDPAIANVFETIASSCRSAVSNMRDLIWATDSRNDKYSSMVDRMKEHAINMLEENGIKYQLIVELDESEYLEMNLRQHLFLIFKEAINNIVKHAHATHVNITLKANDDAFELIIRDNGIDTEGKTSTTGSGMMNMQMRAEKIQAKLEIVQSDGFQIKVYKKFKQ